MRLRRLDQAVAESPGSFLPHAVAFLGLLYVVLAGGGWLSSVLASDHALDGERARAIAATPWCGLPLVLVLFGRFVRGVGALVVVLAAAQFFLARGAWGLEYGYLPIAVCGLLLVCLPQPARPATHAP